MKLDDELVLKIFETLERLGIDTGKSDKIEGLKVQMNFEDESEDILINEIIKAKRKMENNEKN